MVRWHRHLAASLRRLAALLGLVPLALALLPQPCRAQSLASPPSLHLDRQGLQLQDAHGRPLDRLALSAKRWDWRPTADGQALALLSDSRSGELLLVRSEGRRLRLAARWPAPDFAVEALCLYRDPQGLLQVVLLAEDGLSAQWLLAEHGHRTPRELRRLATPPGARSCQVRDAEQKLYLAEPGVGLWAYAADPERSQRELLVHDAQADLPGWLAGHPEAASPAWPWVEPVAQTHPMANAGDAADDPAIWVDKRRPGRSRILATDKKRGLAVYDLQGRELQFLAVGRINNVDLRQGLRYGGQAWDLAAASQRDERGLVLFGINGDGRVHELARLPTELDEVYGLCTARSPAGGLEVLVNDKDGRVLRLAVLREGRHWQTRVLQRWRLASQPEGCVVDESQGVAFVGEEKRGVWRLALADAATEPELAVPLGPTLQADVEGMALHSGPDGRFLVVSSQGSDSYAIFDALPPHSARGHFKIGINAARGIDAVSETDGLDISSASLGPPYEQGLLVVQDGHKRLPQGRQNFKLLPWSAVARTIQPPAHPR